MPNNPPLLVEASALSVLDAVGVPKLNDGCLDFESEDCSVSPNVPVGLGTVLPKRPLPLGTADGSLKGGSAEDSKMLLEAEGFGLGVVEDVERPNPLKGLVELPNALVGAAVRPNGFVATLVAEKMLEV